MPDLDDLVLLALLSLGLGMTTATALQAPEGYEDDTGFHFSDRPVEIGP
jgi:hypothetical protein